MMEKNPEVEAQDDELPRPLVLRVVLGTVLLTVVLVVAAQVILKLRERSVRPSMRFGERTLPAPRTRAGVREETFYRAHPRPGLQEQQRAWLGHYAWVDRERRVVHIPIERAMELVAGRGGQR
jgi:hypothetical protein